MGQIYTLTQSICDTVNWLVREECLSRGFAGETLAALRDI